MSKFGELPSGKTVPQRLREILDGGYNYWTIRPLSSYQSRTALKKKIEVRLRMKNYGVAPGMVKAGKKQEAHDALLAAYRLILDEEGTEYRTAKAKREVTDGSFIVKVSDGQERRFFEMKDAQQWADERIRRRPGMTALFYRDSGVWSKQPFHGLETNEHGHVRVAGVHSVGKSSNQAVGGRSHLRHTFKSMPVGGTFVFKDSHKFTSMAQQGPWVKVSARKYRHDSDTAGKWIYTVGSVNALVEYV